MFARLILALLLAAFAMPGAAPAACHAAAAGPARTVGHHAMPGHAPVDAPDRAIPAHGCIGCIPPSDWMSARIDPPVSAPASAAVEIALRLDLERGPMPMLRPPRSA